MNLAGFDREENDKRGRLSHNGAGFCRERKKNNDKRGRLSHNGGREIIINDKRGRLSHK